MKYRLTSHTSLTNIDGEAVLLDINEGQYYGLNHVGAAFLNNLQEGVNSEQSINELSQNYSTEQQQVENDINELITQLLEKKLLEIIE